MNKFFKLLGLLFLAIMVIGGSMLLVINIKEDAYATSMKSLDPSAANGNLVTAYNTNEDVYFDSYLPKEIKAKKPNQVGYILNVTYGVTHQKYSDGGYAMYSKEGETADVQLIDCSTGDVIASQYFEAYFPEYVEMSDELTVDASDVAEWLTHVYPEWPAGEAPAHNYGPDGCTVCGQLPNAQEETPAESVAEESGTATADSTVPVEEHVPGSENPSLVLGSWSIDWIMDLTTFGMAEGYSDDMLLTVSEDNTALLYTPEESYHFTWTYNGFSVMDGEYSMNYTVVSDSGMSYPLAYYEDGTIAVFTENHSLFFVRQ